MPIRAKIFIAITTAAGLVVWVALISCIGNRLILSSSHATLRLRSWLPTMKVRLPGIESTMSVHFLFVLLGVLIFSLPETLAIGCAAALVQSLWKTQDRPDGVKVLFNVVSMSRRPSSSLTSLTTQRKRRKPTSGRCPITWSALPW